MFFALLILSIAGVSATDVGDICDNKDSMILNNDDFKNSCYSSELIYGNNGDSNSSVSSIASGGLGNSSTSIGSGNSDYYLSNDEISIASTNSSGNSNDVISAIENNISSKESNSLEDEDSSNLNESVKSEKIQTHLSNSGKSIVNGTTYYLSLKDSLGNALSSKTVFLTFNGRNYTRTTNSNGIVGLKIKGKIVQTCKMSYMFEGDENYTATIGLVNIRIKKATAIADSGSTIVKGKNFSVTLKNSNGKALSGRTIVFTVNGKNYVRTTNSRGIASLKINLAANRTYVLSYAYAGSSDYGGSSKSLPLLVKIPTKFANSGSSIIKGKTYYITLMDSRCNALTGKKVKIEYRGISYVKTTNSKGRVGLKINSSPGHSYNLSYNYIGNSEYGPISGKLDLKVKKATYLVSYTSNNITIGSAFKVILKDLSGNVLKNKMVAFNFRGKNYTRKTNSKGIASLTINANGNKTYALSFKYAGSSYYASSSGSIHLTVKNFSYKGINLTYSSVSKRGNTAQYKKGLNEIANLTKSQLKAYLKSSGNDALNSAIKSLSSKLVCGKNTTWDKAQAIFDYVRDYISYRYYSNSKKGAKSTLRSKSANCCDQANLVVALCRAADIPARLSHGQGCRFSSGLVAGHVWAQIYVDGVWYSADATSVRNSLGKIKNWNVKHFYRLKQYAHLPF